jgi:predicted RNase H-like HicB family nuclease
MAKYITIEYWNDEGWYIGRLQEMPGIYNQGQSLEELEKNIKKAYKSLYPEMDETECEIHFYPINPPE